MDYIQWVKTRAGTYRGETDLAIWSIEERKKTVSVCGECDACYSCECSGCHEDNCGCHELNIITAWELYKTEELYCSTDSLQEVKDVAEEETQRLLKESFQCPECGVVRLKDDFFGLSEVYDSEAHWDRDDEWSSLTEPCYLQCIVCPKCGIGLSLAEFEPEWFVNTLKALGCTAIKNKIREIPNIVTMKFEVS